MVATLVAGPAIKNTSAAPGETPFINKTAAIGIEPVAQMYIGTEAAKTTRISNSPNPLKELKKSAGSKTEISAAIKNPRINHLPISCSNSIKA